MYGIIYEHKCEEALIKETRPLTYEEASLAMRQMKEHQDIIRVAIFKLEYATGNKLLIEEEKE